MAASANPSSAAPALAPAGGQAGFDALGNAADARGAADACAGQEGSRRYGRLSAWVWLLALGFPLAELLRSHVSTLHLTLVSIGCAACVAAYSALLLDRRLAMPPGTARAVVFALYALGVAMTAYDRVGWASVLVYSAAAVSIRRLFSSRVAVGLVVLCTATASLLALSKGASAAAAISLGVTCAGVGLLLTSLGQLRARNVELVRAREELARLAVADERLRFARDMHDLLGHSLSVIALKAELAGRLLERDPAAAAVHVGDLETVARGALAEVREAVSGYRKPLLSAELDGARMALQAAGIEPRLVHPDGALSPEVEALLAWTVREGATNVIRHSDARRCSVVIRRDEHGVSAEITDDGGQPHVLRLDDARSAGLASATATPGHGLDGLRERAERLSGRLDAGAGPDGGFRLRVSVPLAGSAPAS